MKNLGTFQSKRWGAITAVLGTYQSADGPLAVVLYDSEGQMLTKLSVSMYKPECSQDSRDLPVGCFYVKTWSENAGLAEEALASGLFIERPDLPESHSGHVSAPAWQLAAMTSEGMLP